MANVNIKCGVGLFNVAQCVLTHHTHVCLGTHVQMLVFTRRKLGPICHKLYRR